MFTCLEYFLNTSIYHTLIFVVEFLNFISIYLTFLNYINIQTCNMIGQYINKLQTSNDIE